MGLAARINKWLAKDEHTPLTSDGDVTFVLSLREIPVAVLKHSDNKWTFRYTEEFKKAEDYRPLVDFPDINKVYESVELWPFFAMRIPSLKQAAIKQIIERDEIDEKDAAEMLQRFGRRSVANPYVLVAE